MSEGQITYEYDTTGKKVELWPDGAVPDAIRILFVARWLNGAASVEWLAQHPEWWEWADICAIAHEQAQAEMAPKPPQGN